jgi:hypothetical protein
MSYLGFRYRSQKVGDKYKHWALPVVTRFNHVDGMSWLVFERHHQVQFQTLCLVNYK